MHEHGRHSSHVSTIFCTCLSFFSFVVSLCKSHEITKMGHAIFIKGSLFLSKGHLVCYPVSTCMAGPSSLAVSVLHLGIHTVSAHPNLASACTAKAPAPKAVNLEKCEQTPVLFCGWERQGLQNPSLELQQNSHTMSYDVRRLQDVGDLDKHG